MFLQIRTVILNRYDEILVQTDGFSPSTGQKNASARDDAFTRGLGLTVMRSPFANAATFLGFVASQVPYSWWISGVAYAPLPEKHNQDRECTTWMPELGTWIYAREVLLILR
ncbi:hypothetical protein BDN67DRAFT_324417 [Paxillus ammoniavirescens]|nr:hypothetical protein BDN67DRAFT_324417 [Paxillus ammoniavirescens]